MVRICAIVVAIYTWGQPGLDAYRPSALDRPLEDLHRDMNRLAADLKQASALLDDARSMRYLNRLSEAFADMQRGG